MNGLFVAVALASVLLAAATGRMEDLTGAILSSARNAVDLAIGLVGVMAFFLGLMRVAENGGLMATIARAVRPVMRRLFPDVPDDSPAISAMILNIAANMMGLGNAATPFGIKAIQELDKLNSRPGTATNAMALFLAINTAGLAVLPSGMIGVRAALGSEDAAGIFFPTWFASGSATIVGVTAALLLSRLGRYRRTEPPSIEAPTAATTTEPERTEVPAAAPAGPEEAPEPLAGRLWIARAFWIALLALAARDFFTRLGAESPVDAFRGMTSFWMLPALVSALVLYGWVRGVRVYDSLVEGAKQGFDVALRIIPFLVAILVAIGMFRAAGGIDALVTALGPITTLIGMPAEVLPVAVLRPLSGSGSLGVAAEIIQTHGPDSLIGYLASTVYGSTETTFYTLAVYFGAVGIRNTRHTLPACLSADVAGILAATFIVNLLFG
ncbi:MAG: spore maturation protein [Acidobacteria bacterium]|nr:spore maturation protein [Acidobacteriota bacterium]MYK90525.1 spore maturation protein [Acidobacteriota bacterium]